jgi:hypothetical protein
MPTVRLTGVSRRELHARLRALPRVLSGRMPDPTGAVRGLQLAMGTALLGKVREAYVLKAQGGTDDMGVSWPPLAASTLALRRKVSGAKAVARLAAAYAGLPAHRRRQVREQYRRLLRLYRDDAGGAAARRAARGLLRRLRAHLPPSRYKRLEAELRAAPAAERARRLALAGAHAEVLRDTGRLLNSLSPGVRSADRVLRAGPGEVVVGSNVAYLKYHQSARPRRRKADGTPRLPRRQVLPDAGRPVPRAWWRAVGGALGRGLADPAFWRAYLTP